MFGAGMIALLGFGWVAAQPARAEADRIPCSPESAPIEDPEFGLTPEFCAEWNPEYVFRGHRCCAKAVKKKKRRATWCAPDRVRVNFCHERTEFQVLYEDLVKTGKAGDILELISTDESQRRQQSFCSVNNGFLAWGRPILSTPSNRIQLRTPERCVNYGTDGMTGMLEWVGRKIATRYSAPEHQGVKLIVGDVSAPKGGCLSGRSGRRGHSSHTSGRDVDLGFLTVKEGRDSPVTFHQAFDARANWWLLKEIFKNPYACVKVVFLDRKMIAKLARTVGAEDPDWEKYRRFIRHVKFHKNHLHVRVGDGPGDPGCVPNPMPELETEEEDGEDTEAMDFLEQISHETAPLAPAPTPSPTHSMTPSATPQTNL